MGMHGGENKYIFKMTASVRIVRRIDLKVRIALLEIRGHRHGLLATLGVFNLDHVLARRQCRQAAHDKLLLRLTVHDFDLDLFQRALHGAAIAGSKDVLAQHLLQVGEQRQV